jgi:regulator of CtrA degradation
MSIPMVSHFNEVASTPISFVLKLTASGSFKALFKEGMSLVEEAAAYLDGAGREDSRTLPRAVALAYATESMRLTTRLMQVASWLLLQRAVNEGEMSQLQAGAEKHRVRLARQDVACAPELFDLLPPRLRDLSLRSLRLQSRVLHLDQSIAVARLPPQPGIQSVIERQVGMLRSAFAGPR